MSKNREIEAKYLLNKTEYNRIIEDFDQKANFSQENYYFDDDSKTLKSHQISLRIRIYVDHAEQTMKVPDANPVQKTFHETIEINDTLPKNKATELVNKAANEHIIFEGNIGQYINQNLSEVKKRLNLFTWSKTQRILLNGPKDCELTLDKTSYPDGYVDYELEIENTNPQLIKEVLDLLINKYHIENNKNQINYSKIARASKHQKVYR